jgi:hypothetical protein
MRDWWWETKKRWKRENAAAKKQRWRVKSGKRRKLERALQVLQEKKVTSWDVGDVRALTVTEMLDLSGAASLARARQLGPDALLALEATLCIDLTPLKGVVIPLEYPGHWTDLYGTSEWS